MATINKTKAGLYELSQLQNEINANVNIVPSCTSISGAATNLTLTFAAALSGAEVTELETVITDHGPTQDPGDARHSAQRLHRNDEPGGRLHALGNDTL